MTLNRSAESYLELLELSATMSHSTRGNVARDAQTVWRGLREARVYDVPDRILQEAATAVKEIMADPGCRVPDMQLPFNALFIGCCVELPVLSLTECADFREVLPDFLFSDASHSPTRITLFGYLLPPDEQCWAFMRYTYADNTCSVLPLRVIKPVVTGSDQPDMYYVLAVMAKAITHHTTQVLKDVPGFGRAMRQRKKLLGMAKVALPVPPPFYEIVVKDVDLNSVMREGTRVSDQRTGWELTHQVEVAGHVKYKIMRGDLPVRAERLAWLAKNKYQLFQGSMQGAPQEILDGLQRRGVWHPDSNEWLAVKVSHVKPYCKGPETGVIVPAVRVVR